MKIRINNNCQGDMEWRKSGTDILKLEVKIDCRSMNPELFERDKGLRKMNKSVEMFFSTREGFYSEEIYFF